MAQTVRLRTIERRDAYEIARLLGDDAEGISWTARIPWPFTIDDAHAWLDRVLPGGGAYAIEADGTFVGGIGIHPIPGVDGAAEVGYWVGKPFRSRGFASAALRLAIDQARREGLLRLVGCVFPGNDASVRTLTGNGFVLSGESEGDFPLRGGLRRMLHFTLDLETILLDVHRWSWRLRARSRLSFAHGANTVRGALGYALADTPEYAEWFRPNASPGDGPSGLATPPRPFVLRVAHLDEAELQTGEEFEVVMHNFESHGTDDRLGTISNALSRAAETGLGRGQGRAEVVSRNVRQILCPLAASACTRLRIRYTTPTELKGGPPDRFATLFGRARDRVATLRSLYGAGALDSTVDFRELGDEAQTIQTLTSQLTPVHDAVRHSTRTGQTHALAGVVGTVEFAGDLKLFLPWLKAAQWTGVGRQTVWGKGALAVEPI